jgi:hypothetical protein
VAHGNLEKSKIEQCLEVQKLGLNMQFSKDKTGLSEALAPIEEEILLCRCSAQEIGTYSGKKLLKNSTIYN